MKKIVISLILSMLMLFSVANAFPITGKVVEISPTSISVQTATETAKKSNEEVVPIIEPATLCTMPDCGRGQRSYYTGKKDTNGCKIYECVEVICSIPACEENQELYDTGEKDNSGCRIYKCISKAEEEVIPTVPECESYQCPDGSWAECRANEGACTCKCPLKEKPIAPSPLCECSCNEETGACICSCPEKTKKPVCSHIGTDREGWYIESELIKQEVCTCRATCKAVEGQVEGYYSTCTGNLIQEADCISENIVITRIKKEPVEVEQQADVVSIKSRETATTQEKLILKEDKIEMDTAEGVKEVKILPEEAKEKAMQVRNIYQVTNIELVKEQERPVYQITAKEKTMFLWIIPLVRERVVKIDAETNEVIE